MALHLVIPARYASSRLPAKPLSMIHGTPMIVRVAERVKGMSGIDSWCVATDHEAIRAVCESAGIPVVMTDSQHPSGTDRLAEVARLQGWDAEDCIVNVQGDEPLIPPRLIRQVAQLLQTKPDCAMATLCEKIHHHEEFYRASVVKVVCSQTQEALYFSRAPIPHERDAAALNPQHLPATALRHLGLYAYRVSMLQDYTRWPMGFLEQQESLEQLRVLENGYRIAIAEAEVSLPPGVDTQQDLDRLNQLPLSTFEWVDD